MFSIWIKDYFSEDYIKLDLFDKETILIKSQLNNLEKLSNVFSDVSNSFTVPATPHNNKALRHWYDRDIITNFNANLNIPAYTEVGSLPYRWGAVSLEGGQMKLKDPHNYKITFFSKNTQLSDTFGNDTIDRLDYDSSGVKQWNSLSQYDFFDTPTNFFNSISNTFQSGNIITPLIINADRDIEWGSGNIFDISQPQYALRNSELYYAFKVSNLIDAIQTKYNVTFDSTFFTQSHFQKIFITLNSNESLNRNQTLLNFTTGNLDDLGFNYATDTWIFYDTNQSLKPSYKIWVNPNVDDVPYSIVIKNQDGIEVTRFDCDGGDYESGVVAVPYSSGAFNINYKFYIESTGSLSYDVRLLLRVKNSFVGNIDRNGHSIGSIVDLMTISERIPKLKVIDFLTGLMKMFKLIIRPISVNEFYIDTLDNYYALGNIINMNKVCKIDEVDFKKPDIYTTIKFKYLKTENVLGEKYRKNNDPINDEIGYGDLRSLYNLDNKKDLTVELPFENMLFERLVASTASAYPLETTNILIGQTSKLTESNTLEKNTDCGPILFYNNGTQSIGTFSIVFQHGTTTASKSVVYNCGNTDNVDIDLVTNSLNWGAEIDPWHLQVVYPSLYLNYWSRWINFVYDLRQMRWTYKAILPIRYINEISLNDSLIIGSKRYRIESQTTNLINGETTFELFIDTDVYLGIPYDL